MGHGIFHGKLFIFHDLTKSVNIPQEYPEKSMVKASLTEGRKFPI